MALALGFFTCLVMTVCIIASVGAEISCFRVGLDMAGCTSYLQKGGEVPASCCAGVERLNQMAQTTPDRQQTCRCLQYASKFIPGLSPTLASSLPGKCGVTIPYPISMTVDCSTIQ